MIDIHSHILPALDDGPKGLDESLEILKQAAEEGITDIILTPHYIKGTSYLSDNKKKRATLDLLQEKLTENLLSLNLYLGNENYITSDIPDLLKTDKILPLANSRYLLVELPLTTFDKTAENIFFELITDGYVPIIAHPERYLYFQETPTLIDQFLSLGCLLQGDYLSLLGKYGRPAKKTLSRLLKTQKIHFLASDIHKASDRYDLKKVYKKVAHLTNKDTAQALFTTNPSKILSNSPIS